MKKAQQRSPEIELIDSLSLNELCRFCHVETQWVSELVEHGVLEPQGNRDEDWRFVGVNIARARKAQRLRRDLGINAPGVAMVLDLIEQRDDLMRRLARYEAM